MKRHGLRLPRRGALLATAIALVACAPCVFALPEVGSGELFWKSPAGLVPMPVVNMKVELAATGMMVRGRVLQEFDNPTSEVIEAIYVFPLPEGAAVDGMEMSIGDRRIIAVIQEKEEAKATYERAKEQGKKTSLVEQSRPNLFTSSVANINPGERVSVRLEYLEEVAYQDGVFSLTFPLTFTARYAPVCSGDASPANASLDPAPPRGDFVPVGGPLSPPRAEVHVGIDAGVPIESVRSPSHAVVAEIQGRTARVDLEGGSVAADRDFVLRWKPALVEAPRGAVFTEDRDGDRYALAMLLPPIPGSEAGHGLATETVFIVDVSGSMGGPSLEQAREALLAALDLLRPGDTFNLVKFSDASEAFRESFRPADPGPLEEAREWVKGLETEGGTEILQALIRGMDMMKAGDPRKFQRIILVTDGAVENEEQVFAELQGRLGESRLHVIGIGPAPNRFFMRKIARFGRGVSDFIGNSQEVSSRMKAFLSRLERPLMTDVSLDWQGAAPLEVYPAKLPDLYVGEPLLVSVRFGPGSRHARAILTGRVHGGSVRSEIEVAEPTAQGSGVATRWARAKVESLVDSLIEGADRDRVRLDVIAVAKTFNLVTRFTSLVAVEEVLTAEGRARTARVAGALPHGSNLLNAELPQGGTYGPLRLLVGLALMAAGGALALATRISR